MKGEKSKVGACAPNLGSRQYKRFREVQTEPLMTNTYFATALVGAHSVGVTIHAQNIGTAFQVAENYLQERYPNSEVLVQAVQRITNETVAAVTPSQIHETDH